MIEDVDGTLLAFLGSRLGKDVDVTVETPGAGWSGGKGSRLSCFLHRVQEDTSWLDADWRDERGGNGRMDGRRAPARHYRLHYLVSAWAGSAAAEHRLLGELMRVCAVTPVVPPEFAVGSLAEHPEHHVRLWLATPTPEAGVDTVDVWSSLGVGARLTLELVLGAVLVPALDTDLAPPAESMTLGISQHGTGTPGAAAEGPVERKWTTLRLREQGSGETKERELKPR